MLARTPWAAMSDARLITAEMAEAAALRGWGRHDAHRLAILVARGTYPAAEAQRELAATLAWHAERAGIRSVSCRALAADMLEEQAGIRDHAAWRIKQVIAPMLAAHRRSNAVLAEAHGVNGAAGFPLTEEEVTDVVRREMFFALPAAPRGFRHAG
jgi:hypothetical protein